MCISLYYTKYTVWGLQINTSYPITIVSPSRNTCWAVKDLWRDFNSILINEKVPGWFTGVAYGLHPYSESKFTAVYVHSNILVYRCDVKKCWTAQTRKCCHGFRVRVTHVQKGKTTREESGAATYTFDIVLWILCIRTHDTQNKLGGVHNVNGGSPHGCHEAIRSFWTSSGPVKFKKTN